MIWSHPIAWLGLATLAVPLLVHWLARHRADPLRFPTLRFLPAAPPLAVRRRRLSDAWLLALRLAILALAVAALAQPWWTSPRRSTWWRSQTARAIIVDTSASMRSATVRGQTAIARARDTARTLAAEVTTATVIEREDVAGALEHASAWLARQTGLLEVAVVSDFQTGSLRAGDLDRLPPASGIRLVTVAAPDTAAMPQPPTIVAQRGDAAIETVVRAQADRTSVTWTDRPESTGTPALAWMAGLADEPAASAAFDAARALSPVLASVGRDVNLDRNPERVVIIFPSATQWKVEAASARAVDDARLFAVADAIARDPSAVEAAADAAAPAVLPAAATVLLRDAGGAPLVGAAMTSEPRLVLFVGVAPGSVTSAAVMAAVLRATNAGGSLVSEIEPERIPAAELKSWERAPGAPSWPSAGGERPSDGRWLWAAVLALLALETWARRERSGPAERIPYARVA